MCTSYFAVKEAEAAVKAKDTAWLKETNCFISPGQFRVVLIDHPDQSDAIWLGRVYGTDDKTGYDFYFRATSVTPYEN